MASALSHFSKILQIPGTGVPRLLAISVGCLISALTFNCRQNSELLRSNAVQPRVISFAPSITETIYALGAQNHLVGVTNFCTYPPEAKALPKVGGYIDPNYEQILRLKPDVAIMLREHKQLITFLEQHNIKTVQIFNENISGILQSFSQIGRACTVPSRGDSLAEYVDSVLKTPFPSIKRHPRILCCVGREKPGSGAIGKVFLAGERTFYSELIYRAGGENACGDSVFSYPSYAAEGIIQLAPDIIIDLMASVKSTDPEIVKADWSSLSMIPAVKNGFVYALTGDYVSIPGPRISQIFNELHRCVSDWAAKDLQEQTWRP